MDVTDIIDYNLGLLSRYDSTACFFHLDRNNPTLGFNFDASRPMGNTWPASIIPPHTRVNEKSHVHHQSEYVYRGLILGSCLAQHLRHQLEEQKGFAATAGISVNKLLSKLVGNLNKPHDQTTLLSTNFWPWGECKSNVQTFLDSHEVGKIPGIGSKTAQKIRDYITNPPSTQDTEPLASTGKSLVTVKDVRCSPDMSPALLEKLIGGPSYRRNIGLRIWALIHGADSSQVSKAIEFPQQISIVSGRLDHFEYLLTFDAGR